MKKYLLCAGLLAASISLVACGGSSSPSDTEDDILSSANDKDESSSSAEPESSSSLDVDLPKGARVATLDDLERNMTLTDMLGRDIYLATGEKTGLFSFWIPDTAWIAVTSDFKDGLLKFNTGVIVSIKIENDAISSMEKLVDKKSDHSMQFIVNEDDQLQYSLDGGDYKDVTEASVKKNSSVLSNGDSLTSKTLFCKTGDDTYTKYDFYKGRYVATDVKDSGKSNRTVVSWSAGYYDIHRSKLLMRPQFYPGSVYELVTASVSSDYETMTVMSNEISCTLEVLKYNEVPAADLEGEWESDEGGLTWSLDMRADRTFEVKAFKGNENKTIKQGIWDVYGNQLLMKMTGCPAGTKCTPAVIGSVSKWKAGSFFNYGNSDPDDPSIPEDWTAPEYE